MLYWHLLLYIVSINSILQFVRSQYDDEESTTISVSTSTGDADEQGVSSSGVITFSRTTNAVLKNENETYPNPIDPTASSKQRIIIALAVLCAALAVLLAFFVSIVVCRWLQQDQDEESYPPRINKARTDFTGSSYNYRDHTYQQTVKL